MSICNICGKKIKLMDMFDYSSDKKQIYHTTCIRNPSKIAEKRKMENEEREYKRKCNQCGKVWHSLVSEELKLTKGGFFDALIGVGTTITGDMGAATQSNRNYDAKNTTLNNLQKCPNCGSRDYKEEIITFKKK